MSTNDIENYLETLAPAEREAVRQQVLVMKADRDAINFASRNHRFSATWDKHFAPETLVRLIFSLIDMHFEKEEGDKHLAFLLVSPDVRSILSKSGDMETWQDPKTLGGAVYMRAKLRDVPVYEDAYLRPDVVYIGSGNLDTPGSLRIESLSCIKIPNMFDKDGRIK